MRSHMKLFGIQRRPKDKAAESSFKQAKYVTRKCKPKPIDSE